MSKLELEALEPRIAGQRLEGSIADFVRSCHVLVGEEQRKPNPDNALIGVLCNAVRFAREHLYLVENYLGEAPEPEQEEPLGLGALTQDDVDRIRRNRTTGPTYNFFKADDDN